MYKEEIRFSKLNFGNFYLHTFLKQFNILTRLKADILMFKVKKRKTFFNFKKDKKYNVTSPTKHVAEKPSVFLLRVKKTSFFLNVLSSTKHRI